MKKLDNKVNIIPVIAKADTISKPELLRFKVRPNTNEVKLQMYQLLNYIL